MTAKQNSKFEGKAGAMEIYLKDFFFSFTSFFPRNRQQTKGTASNFENLAFPREKVTKSIRTIHPFPKNNAIIILTYSMERAPKDAL